jgi:transcriptional regulator with XRE-family HTH domain
MGNKKVKKKSVADFFREIREARDWSQRDLANAIGVSKGYVAQIEVDTFEKVPFGAMKRVYKILTKPEKEILLEVMYQEMRGFIEN